MTKNKIEEMTLPEKSIFNSSIAKKTQYSTYSGAEGEEKVNEVCKT